MTGAIDRPRPGDYIPYTLDYISLVPEDGLITQHLEQNANVLDALVRSYAPGGLAVPHAPGEWTVLDVVQHNIDTERVFAYRTLCIARGEEAELPGYDQDEYAATAIASRRTLDDLLTEYRAVRAATIALTASFDAAAFERAGTANGHRLSLSAATYILVGHELYHLRSLRENYGS